MSFAVQTITIKREIRVSDGAGGKTSTWVPLTTQSNPAGTYQARFHRYKKASDEREEQAAHNSEGAGVETRTVGFFSFVCPYPAVVVNDQIIDAAGSKWIVQFVRSYGWSFQVDVEVLA